MITGNNFRGFRIKILIFFVSRFLCPALILRIEVYITGNKKKEAK